MLRLWKEPKQGPQAIGSHVGPGFRKLTQLQSREGIEEGQMEGGRECCGLHSDWGEAEGWMSVGRTGSLSGDTTDRTWTLFGHNRQEKEGVKDEAQDPQLMVGGRAVLFNRDVM